MLITQFKPPSSTLLGLRFEHGSILGVFLFNVFSADLEDLEIKEGSPRWQSWGWL